MIIVQSTYVFLHVITECFARLSHRLGICPFVCLSITLQYCVKMTQASIMRSSLWAAPKTL